MSIPFGGVLTRPADMNHRAGGMGPPGAYVNQFADRAPPFPGSSMTGLGGNMGGGYVDGKTGFYDWMTNWYSTYHFSQKCDDWRVGDTGPEQFIFGMTEAPSQTLETDKRLHGQQIFGVSMLNYMLQHDPAWRKKFGRMKSASQLMKHINYKGVQIPTQELLNNAGSSRPYSDENVAKVFGRVRIHNIFMASEADRAFTDAGDHLYFIVTRNKYVADAANREGAWKAKKNNTVLVRPNESFAAAAVAAAESASRLSRMFTTPVNTMFWPGFTSETQEFTVAPDFGQCINKVEERNDFGDDAMGLEDPDQEYFWSFNPYTSKTGRLPGPELYETQHGDGCYIQLGMVHHSMTGDNNYSPEKCKLAQEALYPTERCSDYMRALYQLPTIEVHLRIGCKV